MSDEMSEMHRKKLQITCHNMCVYIIHMSDSIQRYQVRITRFGYVFNMGKNPSVYMVYDF